MIKNKTTKTYLLVSLMIQYFISHLYANDSIAINQKEIKLYKEFFLPKNIIVDDSQIEKNIIQNRILFQKYKKQFEINNILNRLIIEKFYANLMLRKFKKNYKIDDKAIKAYFLVHKNKFIRDNYISFDLYELDDYKKVKYKYHYNFINGAMLPSKIQLQLKFLKEGQISNIFECCGKLYKSKLIKRYKKSELNYKHFRDRIKRILIDKNYKKYIQNIVDK